MSPHAYFCPVVETLSERCVLAGNVTLSLNADNTVATVTGDNADNAIVITKVPNSQSLSIAGTNGTTINGAPGLNGIPFSSNGRITIRMRGGNDQVTLGDMAEEFDMDRLSIDMGTGNDTLVIHNISVGSESAAASIKLGSGNNSLLLDGTPEFQGDLVVRGGNENDAINITFADLANGKLVIRAGAGFNNVDLGFNTAASKFEYVGGKDVDDLNVMNMFTPASSIRLGAGNDVLVVSGMAKAVGGLLADDVLIDLGTGNDTAGVQFFFSKKARFKLGSGTNGLTLNVSTITEARIDGGAQNDVVSMNADTFGSLAAALSAGDDSITAVADVKFTNLLSLDGGPGNDNFFVAGVTQFPGNQADIQLTSIGIL